MKAKHIIITAAALVLSNCAALRHQPDSWAGTPNPLDSIEGEPTARELHQENIRAITGNPAYQLAPPPANRVSFAVPCDACGGNGGYHSLDSGIPDRPCDECNGTGASQ